MEFPIELRTDKGSSDCELGGVTFLISELCITLLHTAVVMLGEKALTGEGEREERRACADLSTGETEECSS